jgi:hypothetical protein
LPSFKSLAFFLKSNYISAVRESRGVSDIPDGMAYYDHAINFFTTTTILAFKLTNNPSTDVERFRSFTTGFMVVFPITTACIKK